MVTISDSFPMSHWACMERFIHDNYRPDHALCSRQFFQWLFRVGNAGDSAPILCAWNNDELVAILGCLNLTLHWGDPYRDVNAPGLTHWMSSRNAPRGVGWLLARKALERCPLAITLNSSKIGTPFFQSLGWGFRDSIPRYLCVFDRDTCAAISSTEGASKLVDLLFNPSCEQQKPHLLGIADYAPRWDLYPQMLFGIKRSGDYLRWRYIEHPVFTYYLLISGDGSRPAVCVYRLEKAYGTTEVLVGRILDFFFPDDMEGIAEGTNLLRFALEKLKAVGCAFTEFYCTNNVFGQILLNMGGGVEPTGLCVLPSRLTPIQVLRHDINLTFSSPQGWPVPTDDRLYFTRSDVDGDQPVRLERSTAPPVRASIS